MNRDKEYQRLIDSGLRPEAIEKLRRLDRAAEALTREIRAICPAGAGEDQQGVDDLARALATLRIAVGWAWGGACRTESAWEPPPEFRRGRA